MNIKSIISTVCAALSEPHTFHFADLAEENLNLTAEHITKPVCLLLPFEAKGNVLQQFGDGMQYDKTYSVSVFLMRKSGLDDTWNQRHDDSISPTTSIIPEFITRINLALPSSAQQIESWNETTDRINMFDANLDGVLATFSIPDIGTYCIS